MQVLASRVRPIWPLLTALASGAMLAIAVFYFQGLLALQPCPLCLDQRNWHWAVVGVSVAAFIVVRVKPDLARWAALAIGLVLLGSASMAAYHVAVEQHWVIAQCDARIRADQIRPIDFGEKFEAPKCDQIAWQWLGVSMAGWNAIISLLLALASFAVAALPERKA
jgi:disulfide bond formation protein DsbB